MSMSPWGRYFGVRHLAICLAVGLPAGPVIAQTAPPPLPETEAIAPPPPPLEEEAVVVPPPPPETDPVVVVPPPPPPLPTAMVLIDGQQQGPLDFDAIAAMIADGQVTGDTFVWQEGMAEWQRAAEVPEIAALIDANAPPPPARTYRAMVGGQQQGPFTVEQLVGMAERGEIDASTLVWQQGMADWQALSAVDGLSAVMAAIPRRPDGPGQRTAPVVVESYCSATGAFGVGTGPNYDTAAFNAIQGCVAYGGLPNCCANSLTIVE